MIQFLDPRLPDRFWSKVQPCPISGCWLWVACITLSTGYGDFGWRGGNRSAHRVAYETLVGPVAHGLHLDHLCRVRSCCNPAHLEAVTPKENSRRGDTGKATGALYRSRSHCKNGHPFTGEMSKNGAQRICVTCRAGWARRESIVRRANRLLRRAVADQREPDWDDVSRFDDSAEIDADAVSA